MDIKALIEGVAGSMNEAYRTAIANGEPLLAQHEITTPLRVAHFFATHTMQALPLIGWCTDRWQPAWSRQAVRAAAALSVTIVVFTFIQALRGRPLLPG